MSFKSNPVSTCLDAPRFSMVVVDADGEVFDENRLDQDEELREQLTQPEHVRRLCRRRLFSLETRRQQYVGVAAPLRNDEYALLIQPWKGTEELIDFIGGVDFSFEILNKLISSPFDGMSVVDAEGRIAYLSQIHERFFGLSRGEAIGRHVTEVIENSRMHQVVKSGVAEIAHVQHMRGTSRIVSRIPITRDDRVVGAVGRVMFKGPDQLIEMSRELSKLKTEVEYYKRENLSLRNRTYGLDQIIGSSDAIRKLKSNIARVAEMDVPVLLTGESGTGKELVAQAIHRLSLRRDKAMMVVNAAALPFNLVESELFGYESGSFTGAHRQGRQGKFEAAHGSSLFLDEVGDMPLNVQVKLLRVLQDGTFERIGGSKPRHTDFRLITATHRPLQKMIENEEFRLDLFYRISGVVLNVPPLRERLDDIPELVEHFVISFAQQHQRAAPRVERGVYDYLQAQPWPGNVRQLLHEVERALIFCNGPVLTVDQFQVLDVPGTVTPKAPAISGPQQGESLKEALERVELSAIKEAMKRHQGNKKKVAEVLGISRSYLYKRLEKLEPTAAAGS